jgi:putative addiction module component (TIGR02574 family)
MVSFLDELEAAALGLPRSERARLAERLLSSLDDDAAVEAAWAEEVKSRLERYRAGALEAVPARDVHEEARRRLKQ